MTEAFVKIDPGGEYQPPCLCDECEESRRKAQIQRLIATLESASDVMEGVRAQVAQGGNIDVAIAALATAILNADAAIEGARALGLGVVHG